MNDIFISYAREDRARVEPLAKALEARGWTLWWDLRIDPGAYWDDDIAKALKEAKCVVVLWSKSAVESHWVRTEAEEARARNILVPAKLEEADIPYGFRRIQTADLVDWQGVEPHEGFNELLRGIARVLKQPALIPPPASREQLLTKLRILWRAWPLIGLGIGPFVIGTFLYLSPIHETGVELEARLSEFSFSMSEQQDLLGIIVLSALGTSGLNELHLPRPLDRAAQTHGEARRTGSLFRLASTPPHQGSITLAPVSLPSRSRITIRRGAEPRQLRISLQGSTLPIRINVQGRLQLLLAEGRAESIDFGPPKPIVLMPDDNQVDLDLTLTQLPKNLLSAPLSVGSLALLRIDERLEPQRTIIQEVSTVLSGRLRLTSLGGQERVLPSGEMIQFDNSRGEIRALQVNGDHLALEFYGQVQGMKTCFGKTCTSVMPTRLAWLWAQHRLPLIVAVTAYAFLSIIMSMRWWKGPS